MLSVDAERILADGALCLFAHRTSPGWAFVPAQRRLDADRGTNFRCERDTAP